MSVPPIIAQKIVIFKEYRTPQDIGRVRPYYWSDSPRAVKFGGVLLAILVIQAISILYHLAFGRYYVCSVCAGRVRKRSASCTACGAWFPQQALK